MDRIHELDKEIKELQQEIRDLETRIRLKDQTIDELLDERSSLLEKENNV